MIVKCNSIYKIKGNLVRVKIAGPFVGEHLYIYSSANKVFNGIVICVDHGYIVAQIVEGTLGISNEDTVVFTGEGFKFCVSDEVINRKFNGLGKAIDGGPDLHAGSRELFLTSYNPEARVVPSDIIRTNIPMIDMFNCLLKSQKIPIFSVVGEAYNELLMRVAKQSDADVVIVGGLGLRFEVYSMFVDFLSKNNMNNTVFFAHLAIDPVVECILVPDLVLCTAEYFARLGKNVLVIMSDMTAFADAIREVSVMMDVLPANRGYPGSLYSDLAVRYEQAVAIKNGGSVTILNATTMPGNDITHPVPDNTGYITEGQFYLINGKIEPFGSLSRLKQLVIENKSQRDHGPLANAMIRLYSDAIFAKEREAMGFVLSKYDTKLIKYARDFEENMMKWELDIALEEALSLGWTILARYFSKEETGIRMDILDLYWPISEVSCCA